VKFSTSVEYAIHGLMYLSKAPADALRGGTVLIADIAEATKIPEAYLRKVFQQLSRSGIVTSQRGARGGFSLARPPERITLKDVVEAIDGFLPVYSCLRLQRKCTLDDNCPVKEVFHEARRKMGEVLDAKSIKDVLKEIDKHKQEAVWLRSTA